MTSTLKTALLLGLLSALLVLGGRAIGGESGMIDSALILRPCGVKGGIGS